MADKRILRTDCPPARAVLNWWSAQPKVDWALAAGAVVAALVLREMGRRPVVLDAAARRVLYGAILGAATGFIGFGLTPAAVVLGGTAGVRLRAVLKGHQKELRATIVTGLRRVVLIDCLCITALVVDVTDPGSRPIRYLILGAGIALVPAVLRLIDAFGGLITLISLDKLSNEGFDPQPLPVPVVPPPAEPSRRASRRPRKAVSRS